MSFAAVVAGRPAARLAALAAPALAALLALAGTAAAQDPTPTPAPASSTQPAPTPAAAPAAAPPAPVEPGSPGWSVRSPFPSLARTRQLLDTIGFEVLGAYAAPVGASRPGSLADRPGTQIARTFTRTAEGGEVRTIEIAVAAHPSGGHAIYVAGFETRGARSAPNPDLTQVQAAIQRLVDGLAPAAAQAEGAPIDRRRLASHVYQLSYVEPDRAIALLKALDYTTIEFNDSPGETLYDKIFATNVSDREKMRLPYVIKMISASKTSLQETTAESPAYAYRGSDLLPDLGGIFLHRTTAAEPQNRLMIAYDKDDPESLERIVNLLRDQVDVAARQLMLEALVIEISGDDTKDLGINWSLAGSDTNGRYTNTFDGSVNNTNFPANAPLTFLFNRASDVFSFRVGLHALLQDNKARVLSNPSVLVLDGRQAKIQIGNRIPVVETTVTNASATESVLYFPVGIVLNLRPRISNDGTEVSMQVETIVSSVRSTATTGSTVTRAPEVVSRQVQTIVRVSNDSPFIIGGLTSNEETKNVRGVPLLSKIPWLGALFRRETVQNVTKEIIIVVTPHLVPEDTSAFSYVIPQESPQFDTFGRQLLHNAYRVRQQDVFNLAFLKESDAYRSLVACARRYDAERLGPGISDPEVEALLAGAVPGEEILVRRMLWEIVRKTDYARFVNLDNAILFEDAPEGPAGAAAAPGEGGFALAFLKQKLATFDPKTSALVLEYDVKTSGTPERPFSEPTARVSVEPMSSGRFFARLAEGNRRSAEGTREVSTILLTDAYAGTARPLDVLKGLLVLRRLVVLNPNLPLTLDGFRSGRQIVFPTENELRQSHLLIDPEAARLFHEVTAYYPAFEDEFKNRARRLSERMGGCSWWTAPAALGAAPTTP